LKLENGNKYLTFDTEFDGNLGGIFSPLLSVCAQHRLGILWKEKKKRQFSKKEQFFGVFLLVSCHHLLR